MEAFGIIGMSFGLLAFVQVLHQQKELSALKKALKDSGILNDDYDSKEKD